MSADAPAVLAEALTKRFGSFVAVDAVSFSVGAGEIFGFLGPNGAGKTTTIKMLAGLLPPSGGRGRVAGFDMARERTAIKQRIGYMSQLFSLYGDLTVEENIAFFGGLYGLAPDRLAARRDWVLAMAGLGEQRRRRTSELSLGWKQRLALGCAVLHEPPVLFLDEPTSGVDPLSRRNFWDLIAALAEAGTTVFVSTHYMEEAEYCHRLALMNRGRLIALDSPAALRAGFDLPLLEIASDDSAALVGVLAGASELREVGLFGRSVHAVATDAALAEAAIRARAEGAGIAIAGIARIAPSLEDVFIARVHAAGGAPQG